MTTEPINVEAKARELLAAQYQRDHPDRAKRILAGASDKAAVDAVVTALAASQQQLAEWKLAYEEAEKAREVMRDEWNAAEQQLAEAVEVLRQWKCGACGGSGEYLIRSLATGEYVETVVPCTRCGGSSYHPTARDFLAKHRREG